MAQVINTNSLSLITQNNITFFVSPQKITEEIKNYLEEQQVKPVCAVDFYRAPLFWSAY